MELLDKLASTLFDYGSPETRKRIRPRQITLEQVRLLLFKECDWRGRKLLFDSASIQKVPASKNDIPTVGTEDDRPRIVEVSQGFTYLYKGPAADASLIGEMIFGAVAMSYKGVSLKIHIMDDPERLMCSKVFCVPSSRQVSSGERKASGSDEWHASSNTLSVPVFKEGLPLSFSLDRGDSGFCGDQSPYSSIGSTRDYFSMSDLWDENHQEDFVFHSPPGRKLSASSNSSWQRRSFQSAATRFALGHTPARLLNVPTGVSNLASWDSQVYANSSASDTGTSLASTASSGERRRNKLGLALLITASDAAEMDEVRKCVEHSHQLQALVCRLRLAALTAGAGGRFVSTLHTAAADATRWLSDLLYGPRLQPAWLGLAGSEPLAARARADALLAELCSVIAVADTKHTNFFISTLLTHVLTYHLGWVPTVSPYDTVDPQKVDNPWRGPQPYNALWAQLSDLCGAIGVPPRAAKTIVSGSSNKLLNTLLTVLTYFVRSGEVTKSHFSYRDCEVKECKVISVNRTEGPEFRTKVNGAVPQTSGLKRTKTVNKIGDDSRNCLAPCGNGQEYSSCSTLVASDVSLRRSATLSSLTRQLSTADLSAGTTSQLERKPTTLFAPTPLDSSLTSNSDESEPEQNVVFVLGDDEKLVGLKNKSNDGKRVKKSSKTSEPPDTSLLVQEEKPLACAQGDCSKRSPESPSKCCSQTLQHSKTIKHSGFKFEFDRYPQIVTNYMKSKNLEILDRHYIGKPGNLKLDNFQFDPTVVPPIQEEKCETCYKCLQLESLLQTPTNASEMEYMADIPRPAEPQYAKVSVVEEPRSRETTPKNFVRKRKENTVVVNIRSSNADRVKEEAKAGGSKELTRIEVRRAERAREKNRQVQVRQMIEFPMPSVQLVEGMRKLRAGFDISLLGGVTDHYVPDLILQGIKTSPDSWEKELRRDLELTTYLNKSLSAPVQAVAIIGDTNSWEVRVVGPGRECGAGGMSSLVGAMLDALPAMLRARVPAHQCLSFLEGKLREVCVLSKTLADMLMSTDFCDIATLTKSLNIDVNDVPLLLAVATTHSPEVATRYGITYR